MIVKSHNKEYLYILSGHSLLLPKGLPCHMSEDIGF